MRAEDLNLFDILERDEPRWDDDKPEPVRYMVQDNFGQRVLARLSNLTANYVIDRHPLSDYDLSDFRKVSR